jgi:hypothetical protein
VAVKSQLSARFNTYKVVEGWSFASLYRHILFDLLALWPSFCAMLEFSDSSAKLVGPAGSILVPDDDEITRKLAMLFEGQCEGLGPTEAARRYGYSKQRFFQLLEQFGTHGALGLQSKLRGPKTNYRRTGELERQIIRHRFLDPDASAEVIAQRLQQASHAISIRSVERVISDYGLQKKTLRLLP